MNSVDLTRGSIFRNLTQMTLPMMLGIISMVAFNLVDTYYVGKLGSSELTALSFTFPVITVIFSILQGMGIGTTAAVSKSIGAKKFSMAAVETTNSLFLALAMTLIIATVGLSTIDFAFRTLGASEELLPLINEYMSVWYFTVMFIVIPFIGNSAFRATGDAKTPSMIMFFAVFINAALDPLFIFGYGMVPAMGIKGAALATAVSRFFTLILSLYILHRKQLLTLHFEGIAQVWKCWLRILRIGIPTGLSRMITPVSASVITALLATHGDHAVSAFGVGTRIEFLTASLLIALSFAISPFSGQNYGARKMDRIRKALKMASGFAIAWGVVMSILLYFLAPAIAGLFSQDPQIIETTILFLRIVPVAFGFQGIVLIVNSNLNTLNRPLTASALIITQMIVIYIPLAYLGSSLNGVEGIYTALLCTYVVGGILSYFVSNVCLKKLEASNSIS